MLHALDEISSFYFFLIIWGFLTYIFSLDISFFFELCVFPELSPYYLQNFRILGILNSVIDALRGSLRENCPYSELSGSYFPAFKRTRKTTNAETFHVVGMLDNVSIVTKEA